MYISVSLRVAALHSKKEDEYFIMSSDDGDLENQAELEEKTRLINQVLELQHTLEDLSARVDAVKEENLKLKSENQVLGQYIENLMSASSVFQTTETKSKRNPKAFCSGDTAPVVGVLEADSPNAGQSVLKLGPG
ncbi:hypothetical protein CHARACLAT_020701 [Characodon lateralis]|uniref:Short coiled-coil protein n=1 Tax=Characodon lateralis TaxID=208331 RepID=A0ABU7DTF8_9TELE|nr:hypothetical protein [Characodon lateralis]